ncbi:MAG: peptidylprolyl isomerase [Actinomycetota bacterium]|nr:MAG: peptidylprolyl isomerase [Actinomycetota bacterium]
MTSNRRERELARAKQQRQLERRRTAARARRRRNRIAGVVVAVVAIVGLGTWAVAATRNDSSTASPSPSPSSSSPSWTQPPAMTIDTTTPYVMTLQTSQGAITIQTDPAKAPHTVNSMIFLASQDFFDGTSCHRLATASPFVLQCGDPTGGKGGGPGYTVPDENLPAAGTNNYPRGTVAMANRGAGTAGSQFFLVYRDATLPPAYTIWGKITAGLDVLDKIAAAGTADGSPDGPPKLPVTIDAVTVTPAAPSFSPPPSG